MAKKKTKRTTTTKTKPKREPGVIASLVEYLTKASKTKPLTKEQLLARLVKRFPERGEEAMWRTINCQVPSRLRSDKKLKVQKNDKTPAGYWIS